VAWVVVHRQAKWVAACHLLFSSIGFPNVTRVGLVGSRHYSLAMHDLFSNTLSIENFGTIEYLVRDDQGRGTIAVCTCLLGVALAFWASWVFHGIGSRRINTAYGRFLGFPVAWI